MRLFLIILKKQNKSKSKLLYIVSKKKPIKLKEKNIFLEDTLDSF